MWRGKDFGKNTSGRASDPTGTEVHENDHNQWCEYFVADMALEESTHTVIS